MDNISSERKMLYQKGFKALIRPILVWTSAYSIFFLVIFVSGIRLPGLLSVALMGVEIFLVIKLLWQLYEFVRHKGELEKYLKEKYK
jgi:hypothetical protein